MSTMEDRLSKLREERMAREKARIEKLRELNLKKYNKNDTPSSSIASVPSTHKLVKSNSMPIKNNNVAVKNNFHVDGTTKRPLTATIPMKSAKDIKTKGDKANEPKTKEDLKVKTKQNINIGASNSDEKKARPAIVDEKKARPVIVDEKKARPAIVDEKKARPAIVDEKKVPITAFKPTSATIKTISNASNTSNISMKINDNKQSIDKTDGINEINAPVAKSANVLTEMKPFKEIDPKLTRKSIAGFQRPASKAPIARKSMLPNVDSSKPHESVFDRLYKPKLVAKKTVDNVEKLKTDPSYLKKVIRNSGLILKRQTCFETKEAKEPPRRSISAVHLKRISKNEIPNCIHKWASIGDKLNKQHLSIDEAEEVKEDKVVSAVKSERKKVKFMTPMSHLNTPRPDELQSRLKAWLLKRGKSLDAYQHLQCFGMNHLSKKPLYLDVTPNIDRNDDENKENIAVETDSDDGSYSDNMNKEKEKKSEIEFDKWRQTSFSSESAGFNDTGDWNETTLTSTDTFSYIDDLLMGTLNELSMLLKDGFEWQQGAVYLRAIRTHYPAAPRTAAYWECRAALEGARGDLHASVHCWEQAIAKGTQHKVVESSLETLLNKFMQLKISPNSTKRQPDPKLVDVKNVFKSTIIKFAVQKAKLRQSADAPTTPVFTVTPVRRSGRLTSVSSVPRATPTMPRLATQRFTPLRICDSVREAATIVPSHVFTPNENLFHTP